MRSLVSRSTSFFASIVLRNSTTVSGSVEVSPSFAANWNPYLLGFSLIMAQGLSATPLCIIALWNNPVQTKLKLSIFPMFSIFSESMNFSMSEDTIRYTEYLYNSLLLQKYIQEDGIYIFYARYIFIFDFLQKLYSFLSFFFLFTYLHLCAEHSKNGEICYITRISILG